MTSFVNHGAKQNRRSSHQLQSSSHQDQDPCSQVLVVAHINRVGQNRIYTLYMALHSMQSLQTIPYIHRIYMVLANPTHEHCASSSKCNVPCIPQSSHHDRSPHSQVCCTHQHCASSKCNGLCTPNSSQIPHTIIEVHTRRCEVHTRRCDLRITTVQAQMVTGKELPNPHTMIEVHTRRLAGVMYASQLCKLQLEWATCKRND